MGAGTGFMVEARSQYIGKRGRVLYEADHKPVATWVSTKDYDLLVRLAEIHKIKLSVYLRAIIVDALQDERLSSTNIETRREA